MFEQDYKLGKISQMSRTSKGQALIKEMMRGHYERLKNLFGDVASRSSYPTIELHDFKVFLDSCQIQDLSQSTLDGLLLKTTINLDENALYRFEFLEMVVRLAQAKYKDTKVLPSLRDALEKFITVDILPNFNVEKP